MRHHQARFGQLLAPIQNQVEVQRSGSTGRRPLAASLSLDRQQPVQQRACREGGVPHHDTIQVARLIGNAYRSRVEPG